MMKKRGVGVSLDRAAAQPQSRCTHKVMNNRELRCFFFYFFFFFFKGGGVMTVRRGGQWWQGSRQNAQRAHMHTQERESIPCQLQRKFQRLKVSSFQGWGIGVRKRILDSNPGISILHNSISFLSLTLSNNETNLNQLSIIHS